MDSYAELSAALAQDELMEVAGALIHLQSHPGIDTHEEAVAGYIVEYLKPRGIMAEIHPVGEHRVNVLARIPGKNREKTLMFTGHMDTVGDYGHAGLFEPVWRDGVLYGRGACDMKGPIAAMLQAVAMLQRLGQKPACDLLLAFVADEEFQSVGTEALINASIRADAAVLGEPTGMKLCLGNRGLEWADIWVKGIGGHGSATGAQVNAVVNAARLIERIERDIRPLFAGRNHPILGNPQLNIGYIKGGNQPSTVPESCLIKLDRRWIQGESVASVYAEMQSVMDTLKAEDPHFEATLSRDLSNLYTMEHGPVCIELEHAVVRALGEALTKLTGQMPETGAFPGWTDASLLGNFGGIPTLIAGPGDIACAHSEQECVSLAQLKLAAKAYALTALTFA